MSILGRLALLFVIVPLLELALLIQMGQWVGVRPTIGLVVLTGVGGAVLARAQGLRTMWRLRHDLANGRIPGQAIMDGMAVLAGGARLLTPHPRAPARCPRSAALVARWLPDASMHG